MAEAVVRVLGEKKGIDVSQMTGIDFAAFKETQYDILAAELRKHLDMKKFDESIVDICLPRRMMNPLWNPL